MDEKGKLCYYGLSRRSRFESYRVSEVLMEEPGTSGRAVRLRILSVTVAHPHYFAFTPLHPESAGAMDFYE